MNVLQINHCRCDSMFRVVLCWKVKQVFFQGCSDWSHDPAAFIFPLTPTRFALPVENLKQDVLCFFFLLLICFVLPTMTFVSPLINKGQFFKCTASSFSVNTFSHLSSESWQLLKINTVSFLFFKIPDQIGLCEVLKAWCFALKDNPDLKQPTTMPSLLTSNVPQQTSEAFAERLDLCLVWIAQIVLFLVKSLKTIYFYPSISLSCSPLCWTIT